MLISNIDELIKMSHDCAKRGHDEHYQIPDYVQKFIYDMNMCLPKGYKTKPWTIMRAVSIWHEDKHIHTVTYEGIEDFPNIGSIVLEKINRGVAKR